jgi:hypothetical protein
MDIRVRARNVNASRQAVTALCHPSRVSTRRCGFFLFIRLDPLRRIAILVELRAPSSFDDGAEDERCLSFQGIVDGAVHP